MRSPDFTIFAAILCALLYTTQSFTPFINPTIAKAQKSSMSSALHSTQPVPPRPHHSRLSKLIRSLSKPLALAVPAAVFTQPALASMPPDIKAPPAAIERPLDESLNSLSDPSIGGDEISPSSLEGDEEGVKEDGGRDFGSLYVAPPPPTTTLEKMQNFYSDEPVIAVPVTVVGGAGLYYVRSFQKKKNEKKELERLEQVRETLLYLCNT